MMENMRMLLRQVRGNAGPVMALLCVNLLVYRDYWAGTLIFGGKDFLTSFYPLLNFQSDCLAEGSFPLWNPFMNFGYPYVEHYVNTALFPTHFLMGVLNISSLAMIQRELLFWIFMGGVGIYLCVRAQGLSRLTGVVSGIAFICCGQIVPLPQWSLLVYNASCMPFVLYGYLRAKQDAASFSLISILFLAMMILGGYVVATVLGLYLFIAFVLIDAVLEKRFLFGIKCLAITVVTALLLSLPKLVPLYFGMVAGPRMADPAAGGGDAFNVINAYNFMSYLLPVKFYFNLYIGTLGIVAIMYAMLRRKIRVNSFLVLFFASAWLLYVDGNGNASLLRELSYTLPFMKLVRNEWLLWFYPSIFLILWLARPVESFLRDEGTRSKAMAALLYGLSASMLFFSFYNTDLFLLALMLQLLLAAVWFLTAFLRQRPRVFAAAVVILMTADLLLSFARVSVDRPPLRGENQLGIEVVDQSIQSRSYTDDLRRPLFQAWMTRDELRPPVSESRGNPVLISGLGGDPGYNLYPEQYARFIDSMNLKRFAGWWYNTQERFEFMQLKDSPLLAETEGWPLFAFFDAAARTPQEHAVSFDGISCSSFSFGVQAPSPGFLLLNQMHDPQWKVFVDGRERQVTRANTYFMGVDLDQGSHRVEFVFRDRRFTISVALSLVTLCALIALCVRKARRVRQPA